MRLDQIRLDHIRLDQMRSDDIRYNQMQSDGIRLYQIGDDEIEQHDNSLNSTALGYDQPLWLPLVRLMILQISLNDP